MASKSVQQEPEHGEVIEELLNDLDLAVDRVKVLYEQYFLGIQKQPPSFFHTDVERKIRDLSQLQIRNTALRYRFVTLQQKYGSYNAYWRRTLRQIENGTYVRSLYKLGRQAARGGEEIPEEILAAMPQRMREHVRRDREAVLATADRRRTERSSGTPTEPDNPIVESAPSNAADFESESDTAPQTSSADASPAHTPIPFHLFDDEDDLDIEAMFKAISTDDAPSSPAAPASPSPAPAATPSPPPAATPSPRPPATLSPRPPATLSPRPPATLSPRPPATPPPRPPATPPPRPATASPRPLAAPSPPPPATLPVAPSQQTRANPVRPGSSATHVATAPPEQATGPFPRDLPTDQTTIVTLRGTAKPTPLPPLPKLPPLASSRTLSSQGAGSAMPAVRGPAQTTPPIPKPVIPAIPALKPPPAPLRSPRSPALPPPRPSPAPRAPTAPPAPPARAAPPLSAGAPATAGERLPPGMTDADVKALYAKYVKAKQMVGEPVGPGSLAMLVQTINAQAPKILEQYKAKAVDFSVVVKDNQVILRAKPKPKP